MEIPDLPSLAARVRFYRLQCGLTQRGLERLCQLKHPLITNIEAGHVQPRVDVVQRLAQAFGVCVSTLVPCTHPPPREDALCRDD